MKSLLPIILIILVLTGAITYSLSKRSIVKREENRFGIPANELEGSIVTPTATPKITALPTAKPSITTTPTLTPTPKTVEGVISALPTVTESISETKGGEKISPVATTKVTKTIVCTPVYGQANTCTEHIVVDTGAADAIFFNFAGLSYLAGLASFVLAKRS